MRNTTVLPVRSTPAASANTLGRPSNTKPTTPSGARRASTLHPSWSTVPTAASRRRSLAAHPRSPAIMPAQHRRRQLEAGGRAAARVGARRRRRRWRASDRDDVAASASRSANRSKKREICSSVHARQRRERVVARHRRRRDAIACSAAGRAAARRSSGRRAAGRRPERCRQLVGDGGDTVAAEHDRLTRVTAPVSCCTPVDRTSSGSSVRSPDGLPQRSDRCDADDRLYFRQLLSGRDFAVDDQIAAQMVNFVYAIGDRATGECVLVDPAYDPAGLVDTRRRRRHDGRRRARHPLPRRSRRRQHDGLPHRRRRRPARARQLPDPRPARRGAVGDAHLRCDRGRSRRPRLRRRGDGRRPRRSSSCTRPATRPGSQCFLVAGKLVSGDTLFLDGCGRTDLPGSDPPLMVESLKRLARVDDDVILYPGHRYSLASSATMAAVKQTNYVFEATGLTSSAPATPARRSSAARWYAIVRARPSRRSIDRLPAQHLAGQRDVGAAHPRVVGRQGQVHHGRARSGQLEHQLGQLAHRHLVRIADVDRPVDRPSSSANSPVTSSST